MPPGDTRLARTHRQWPDSGSLPLKQRFPTDRGQPHWMRGRDGSFGRRKVCQLYGCAPRWGRLASPVSQSTVGRCLPSPCVLYQNLTLPDHVLSKTACWTRRFFFARPTFPPYNRKGKKEEIHSVLKARQKTHFSGKNWDGDYRSTSAGITPFWVADISHAHSHFVSFHLCIVPSLKP